MLPCFFSNDVRFNSCLAINILHCVATNNSPLLGLSVVNVQAKMADSTITDMVCKASCSAPLERMLF
jgi:hypothetical protein